MKDVLTLDVGSSSIKYRLYENGKIVLDKDMQRVHDFRKAAKAVIVDLSGKRIDVVAYRVVHGGTLRKHCVITSSVMQKLKKAVELAPEHMPQTVSIIESFMQNVDAKHIACFDTALYADMPAYASTYAIPRSISKKYGITRYGFHGLAHEDLFEQVRVRNAITCQLGNGVSITVFRNGKAVDTTMGFTPLEGIMMGTRSGSIDPALVEFLCKHERKSVSEVTRMLEEQSGFLGLTGKSDVRDVLAMRGDKDAKLAVDMFCYQIEKQLGAYAAVLGKVDAVVFGGGVSKNPAIIDRLRKTVKRLGAKLLVAETDEHEMMVRISKRL